MRKQVMEKTDRLSDHEIVSSTDWLVARKDLLKREKELTRLRDQLSAERRALPWVKIDKEYIFDAPEGKVTLADLFAGRSQLFIKHFMMGPGQASAMRRLLSGSRPSRRHSCPSSEPRRQLRSGSAGANRRD